MSNLSILQARLSALRQRMALLPEDKKVDGLLLSDITNLGYVTGFTGSTAFAIVTPQEAIFITDGRYTVRAKSECLCFTPKIAAGSGGYPEALKESIDGLPKLKRIGFEASKLSVTQWEKYKTDLPQVDWISTEGLVEDLRMIKDADEIAIIRRAITLAESAFEQVKPLIKAGAQEREIALAMEFAMRRDGADGIAFDTIVASGPQGALPHHHPNGRVLVPGDLVTIDWGASVDGYNSDITRTIAVGGAPLTDKQREVYQIVLEAQQKAIAAIAPGKNGKEIDAIARDHIASYGYGEAFAHSLGHSLGRQTHDGAGFSTRSEANVLKPGMVMTVEPGIYLEDWGGVRIEEDVLVTETGHEILTHLPNALEILG